MDVQELEYNADMRIKFASINEKGQYVGDAHYDLYDSFIMEVVQEASWLPTEVPQIETKHEYMRRAWIFSKSTDQIAVVEHETGVEILVGITAAVAAAAIVGFTKWAWKEWKKLRSSQPNDLGFTVPNVEPSLVIEIVTDRWADGRIRTLKRSEVRGPVDAQVVGKHVEESFAELSSSI